MTARITGVTAFFQTAMRNAALLGALALAACTTPDGPTDIFDPYEEQNRATHEFNTGVDTYVLRPASQAYGTVLPPAARRLIGNVADNIALTGDIVNDVLQARGEDAGHSSQGSLR